MRIDVRNPLPGESKEDYQRYLDELFRPLGDAVQRLRVAAQAIFSEPDEERTT